MYEERYEESRFEVAYATPGRSREGAETLARGLGWFSIALGTAEVLAPGALARALGMPHKEGLIRAYGVREIASGVAILQSEDPTPWVWARVGGDALDIATLSQGLDADNPRKGNVEIALAAVAGVAVLDVLCGRKLRSNGTSTPRMPLQYYERSGLPRPPEEMRGAARDFQVPADMRTPELMRPYTS
jgi:hypothetical protein